MCVGFGLFLHALSYCSRHYFASLQVYGVRAPCLFYEIICFRKLVRFQIAVFVEGLGFGVARRHDTLGGFKLELRLEEQKQAIFVLEDEFLCDVKQHRASSVNTWRIIAFNHF